MAAIAFDLDGTLLDTLADLATATQASLHEYGLQAPPLARFPQLVGSGLRRLMEGALAEAEAQNFSRPLWDDAKRREQIDSLLQAFPRHYASCLTVATHPYPTVLETLATLKAEGHRLAVLTNKPQPFADALVAHFFPPETFVAVLGQRAGDHPKPDLRFSQKLEEATGHPLADWFYVGDSNVDVWTAKQAGMGFAGACWGFRGAIELQEAGAPYLLDRMADLLPLLSQLGLRKGD